MRRIENSHGSDNWARYDRTRRIYSYDRLPMPRAFMHGPKWQRHFGVRALLVREMPPPGIDVNRGDFSDARRYLAFTFEHDVRELVVKELRPGVVAQWSDPLERWR